MVEDIITLKSAEVDIINRKRIGLLLFAMSIIVGSFCERGYCSQIKQGMLVKPVSESGMLLLKTVDGISSVESNRNAKVQRAQVGLNAKAVSLEQLHCGDQVIVTLDAKGKAESVKASFGYVKGVFTRSEVRTLFLADGRRVKLADGARVFLLEGGLGKVGELKSGSDVICILNPNSCQAWEVYESRASKAKPVVARPKILSLQYSPLGDIKAGESITVEMKGSVGGEASCEVAGLTASTSMKEISAGYYRSVIVANKIVSNAPLVGKLTVGGVKASAVQAGRLVCVGKQAGPLVARGQANIQMPEPPVTKSVAHESQIPSVPDILPAQPSAPQLAVPITNIPKHPERGKDLANIVILTPKDDEKIRYAISVTGKASPESKVSVTITYTNGLNGLLKLAGVVASQIIAVGEDGRFKMIPVALDGRLVTPGLRYTIKAYYADREDHGTAVSVVMGDRSS